MSDICKQKEKLDSLIEQHVANKTRYLYFRTYEKFPKSQLIPIYNVLLVKMLQDQGYHVVHHVDEYYKIDLFPVKPIDYQKLYEAIFGPGVEML